MRLDHLLICKLFSDDYFLRRFLYACEHSLEKTKALIDLCFTIRSQAPEIFDNRDPSNPAIQNALKIMWVRILKIFQININSCFSDLVPLPKVTSNNYKLFIYRLADFDPDKFVFADAVKTFLTVADVRLLSDPEFPDGEVPIFDMAGFSLRHATKFTLPLIKKYMAYSQVRYTWTYSGCNILPPSRMSTKRAKLWLSYILEACNIWLL